MYGIDNMSKGFTKYDDESCCTIKNLNNICPNIDCYGLDLLQKMLHLDPNKRITAWEALNHDYFKN